jgi:hypothetical protein
MAFLTHRLLLRMMRLRMLVMVVMMVTMEMMVMTSILRSLTPPPARRSTRDA